ncbi:MAG: methylated-DNA--[protein]-cysteine S-methyltransferase [Spirochaetia bacterium]|nr:methylated-DNA--[protein]-cysteine S-methyltransferase [Spirochaetia bacterium]
MNEKCSVFDTAFGCAALVSGDDGLKAFYLPSASAVLLQKIRLDFPQASIGGSTVIKNAQILIRRYFKGHKVSFETVKTDLSVCGKFTRSVLERVSTIPYGESRSYSWAGRGKPRAAGRALGTNPLPVIIPCHRVVKMDGSCGGFSGGIKWKKKLLELEKYREPA